MTACKFPYPLFFGASAYFHVYLTPLKRDGASCLIALMTQARCHRPRMKQLPQMNPMWTKLEICEQGLVVWDLVPLRALHAPGLTTKEVQRELIQKTVQCVLSRVL